MMRFLVRFILSLCFLLWGANARTNQCDTGYSSEKNFEASVRANISAVQNDHVKISRPTSPFTEKEREKIKATVEEDDDETESFKKHAKTGNSCISFFDARAPGYTHHNNNRLPLCDHCSWSSSDKCILHCVIRI